MITARRLALACLLLSATASADEARLSIKIDPSIGGALRGPQQDAFGYGGGGLVKPAYGPTDWLDFQLPIGGLVFPSRDAMEESALFAIGAGARIQAPQRRHRVSPFFDAEPLFVRTGELNRFGFAASAGVLVALDRKRDYWLGFHVRYLQVMQGQEPGFDTTDASLLLFGVSSQIGFSRKPAPPKPPARIDSDNDGLDDTEDRCPMLEGPRDNDGCPWPDSDKDSVLDKVDKCPAIAGPVENEGCPWPDTDGDTVADKDDKCPSVPGLVAFAGCPDADGDGVAEPPDLCPDTPGPVDNNGCPRYKDIVITRKHIELNQKIFFAYDKADILPKSYALLDEVAIAFKDYPGLKVRIEGHTDSRGSLKHNMKLSQARADSVKQYMLDHGVTEDRILSSIGYGPTQPLETNKTDEGRERNRRVEFVVEGLGDEIKTPAP
ncbi:MAG TPA: OmpA family protein [Kofleriaceae bacterium]|nr:OmpA family protein [Kofleriaceae bacterium]